MNSLDCLALFRSIHDVMKAEELLLERGASYDLVPTPRALSTSCGMAIALRCPEAAEIALFLGERDAEITSLYRKAPEGYEPFDR
jgi:hypothetical protein